MSLLLTQLLAHAGSLLVSKDENDGKIAINALPFATLILLSTSIGCYFDTEPFSQCMNSVLASFAELLK
jgi:hypothetical protein